MFHEVWGQKDQPSGRDRNPVQILALSFHITGYHAPTRASFHPKTRQKDFHYDAISSCVLKSRFGEGWFSTFLAPLLLIFFQGKWAKMEFLTNYWVVSLHLCCNDIYLSKKHHLNKNNPDWCSRWWVLADWQCNVGCTPRAIRHVWPSWQHSSSSAISRCTELYCCQLGRPYSIHISKVPPLGASVNPLCHSSTIYRQTPPPRVCFLPV